jgi:hypothetical protein
MKRVRITLYLLLFFITTLWNCEKKQVLSDSGSQSAVVFVEHYYYGRRAPAWERIYTPSIYATADITGDPLPEINYVQIAGKQFSGPEHFYYDQGNVHFSSEERIWSDSIPEPGAKPNLKGGGFGYLYLENITKSSDRTIVIGKGIDYSVFYKRAATASAKKFSPNTRLQKIKNRLGL